MTQFFRSRVRSFKFAFTGWWYVIRTQRNAWIHALASLFVVGLSFLAQLSPQDWAVIVLSIALVWTAEFFNSALEAIVDLTSPDEHYLAKVGKDVGAAAVLIAALTSVIIGVLILGPPLFLRIVTIMR